MESADLLTQYTLIAKTRKLKINAVVIFMGFPGTPLLQRERTLAPNLVCRTEYHQGCWRKHRMAVVLSVTPKGEKTESFAIGRDMLRE